MRSMRHTINQLCGQTIGEYSIMLGMALMSLVAMTFFLQRGFSARLRDAKAYVGLTLEEEVRQARSMRTGGQADVAPVLYDYEPYYQKQQSVAERRTEDVDSFVGAGLTTLEKFSNVTLQSQGEELPARDDFWKDSGLTIEPPHIE